MVDSTESRWFKIVVFLLTSIVVGVCIANIVYFNRIRGNTCVAMTHGEATAMVWVNVILLILTGIIWIWSLWRLFFSHDTRNQITHYMVAPNEGANMGYNYTNVPVAVATSSDSSAMVVAPNEQNVILQAQKYE